MKRWFAAISAAAAVGAAALALTLTGCSAATPQPGATASLPADAPLVAFYGDSYTRGSGATDPSQRWSTRIAEGRAWREINPSLDGLGFVNNRAELHADLPGEIIAADPDIVIITMGLNDVFSYERAGDGIREQIEQDFERLDDSLPDARIIVVEPFWYTAERPESLEVIIGWVRDAAEDIGAEHIAGASTWIQGREGEMADDGIHPNDAGYEIIAKKMDAALAELGL